MHEAKRLQASFAKLWQKYCKRLAACQVLPSESAVHKLRISCRRLLALLQLLQRLVSHPSLRKLRKALKSQLDQFDELRDTQVMLLEVSERIDALPDSASYQRYLQRNEQRLLKQADLAIANFDITSLERLFAKAEKSVNAGLGKVELKAAILQAVDECFAAALERYRLIDPERPETLHQLRIAVKKLRYMLAAAEALLPAMPHNHLQHLQTYLTRLGEIQNSCVLLDNLNRFFGHYPPADIQTYYYQRHQALLHDYLDHSHEIMLFWRPSTNQPFPWQFLET